MKAGGRRRTEDICEKFTLFAFASVACVQFVVSGGSSVEEWESLLFSPSSIRSFALFRSSAASKRTSLIFSVMESVLVEATNSFGKV